MNRNKSDFLNHLAESRREVEQWPVWKQDSLKASQRDADGSSIAERRTSSERKCRLK